jgi:hypothetical protein
MELKQIEALIRKAPRRLGQNVIVRPSPAENVAGRADAEE